MNEDIKINNIDKWTVKPNEDGYKSPIEMIVEDLNIKIENDIVKAIQNYDIKVDREELAKALAYDRDQYSKGFAEARKKYERPQGKLIDIGNTGACNFCSVCKEFILSTHYNFCPNCGAQMVRGEKNETN
jgi:hypothetical protein